METHEIREALRQRRAPLDRRRRWNTARRWGRVVLTLCLIAWAITLLPRLRSKRFWASTPSLTSTTRVWAKTAS